MSNAKVDVFFDPATYTYSYIVSDPETSQCAIIDSVLDYDPASGRTSTKSADQIITHVKENQLTVEWLLETHVHADHLSGANYLHQKLGGKLAIGEHVADIQSIFSQLFNAEPEFKTDGSQFDKLLGDGEHFRIGNLKATAIHTPGHTPACMTYLIEDAAFVGDTLFMPDYGTARCDFPGGNAHTLYQSIQKIYALPDDTKIYMCHDYKAPGRDEYLYLTSVKEQRQSNVHIHEGISEADFVSMRETKDAKLDMPVLILPSVQVNMRAGQLPPAEANGTRYLKIPLDKI